MARGWGPRSGKVINSQGLSLFLIPHGSGEPQVRIGDPHPITGAGEVAKADPRGKLTWLGLLMYPSLHLWVRQSGGIELRGASNVHWYGSRLRWCIGPVFQHLRRPPDLHLLRAGCGAVGLLSVAATSTSRADRWMSGPLAAGA